MAYYTDIQTPSSIERLLARVAHSLEQAAVTHARYRIYRNSLAELSALSDRELQDLGMSRYDIKDVAMQSALKQVAL